MRRIAPWASCVGASCVASWMLAIGGCQEPKTGEDPQIAEKSPQAAMLEPVDAPGEDRGQKVAEPPEAGSPLTQPAPPVSAAKPLPPSQYADATSTSSSSQMRVHIVQPKETLYSIARRYYADEKQWRRVFQANRNRIRDPNRIEAGMKLIIP